MAYEKTRLISRRNLLAAASAALPLGALAGTQSVMAPSTQTKRGEIIKHFEFSRGTGSILPCFTDYDLHTEGFQFMAGIRELPQEIEVFSPNRRAYYLSANNRSDDIFMFLKAPITAADGILKNRGYKVSFQIDFASNSTDCIGQGGGESSVYLKAGGAAVEPVPWLTGSFVSINVDKGNQAQGGKDLDLIGSIWNGEECELDPKQRKWVMLRRTYDHPTTISTTSDQLWIAVGTDSGYEAVTGVYYYSIIVRITPADS